MSSPSYLRPRKRKDPSLYQVLGLASVVLLLLIGLVALVGLASRAPTTPGTPGASRSNSPAATEAVPSQAKDMALIEEWFRENWHPKADRFEVDHVDEDQEGEGRSYIVRARAPSPWSGGWQHTRYYFVVEDNQVTFANPWGR